MICILPLGHLIRTVSTVFIFPSPKWAMFWIVFQLGSLIGFIFLGIAAFKLTPEEKAALDKSAAAVKELCESVDKLMA